MLRSVLGSSLYPVSYVAKVSFIVGKLELPTVLQSFQCGRTVGALVKYLLAGKYSWTSTCLVMSEYTITV